MFDRRAILESIEFSPTLFSLVHRYGRGADINRRVFVNLIHPREVVIEIGANRGAYTTLFSRLVGKGGQVHAFEPVNQNFERLKARLRSANASNVSAWQMAVGDGNVSESEIITPGDDAQQASLIAHERGSWLGAKEMLREMVRVTALDAYVLNQKIPRVDFVKVDVEGAELLVLMGGRKCFTEFKPLLHMEMESEWLRDFGATPGRVMQLLESFGYNFVYKMDVTRLKGFQRLNEQELLNMRGGQVSGDFLFSTGRL